MHKYQVSTSLGCQTACIINWCRHLAVSLVDLGHHSRDFSGTGSAPRRVAEAAITIETMLSATDEVGYQNEANFQDDENHRCNT